MREIVESEGGVTPAEAGEGEAIIKALQGPEVLVTSCTAWAGLGGPWPPPAPSFVSKYACQG